MAFDYKQDNDTWGGSGPPVDRPSTGGAPSYGPSNGGYGQPPFGSTAPLSGSYGNGTFAPGGQMTPGNTNYNSTASTRTASSILDDDPHGVSGYSAASYPPTHGTYPSIDLYGGSVTPSGVSIFPPVQVGWDNLARKQLQSLQPSQPTQPSTPTELSPTGKRLLFQDPHSAPASYAASTPSTGSQYGSSLQSTGQSPSLPYSTPDPKPNSVTLWTSPRGQVNKVWGQPNTPLYYDSVKYGSIRKRYVNTTTQQTTATYYDLPDNVGIVYDSAVNQGRQLGWIRLNDPKRTLQPMGTLPAPKRNPVQPVAKKGSGPTTAQKYAVQLNTPGIGLKWVDSPIDQRHAKGNMLQYASRKAWQAVDPHTLLPQVIARVPVIGLPGYFYYYFKDTSKIIIGPNTGYSNHIIEPDTGKYAVFASYADVQNDKPIVGDPANIPPPARPVADKYSYMTGPEFYGGFLRSGVQGVHDLVEHATKRLPVSDDSKQDITGAVTTVAGASTFVPQLIANAVSAASMDENADGSSATAKDRLKNVGQVFLDTGKAMISGPDMQHLIRGVSLLTGPDGDSDSTWQKEFGAVINDMASHPLTTATMIVLAKGDEGLLQARARTLDVAEGTYRRIASKAAGRGDTAGAAIALAKANKLELAREWILDNAARQSKGALTLNPRTWIQQAKSLPADVRTGLQRARGTADRVQPVQKPVVKPKSTSPPPSAKPFKPTSPSPEAPGKPGAFDMWHDSRWGYRNPDPSEENWGYNSKPQAPKSNPSALRPFDWKRDFWGDSLFDNKLGAGKQTQSIASPLEDPLDLGGEWNTTEHDDVAEPEVPKSPVKPSLSGAVASVTKKISKRLQYLGRTPGKNSRTGRQVIHRMIEEGKVQADENNNLVIYHEPTDTWHPYELTDMGHIRDAVEWWNNVGILFGPKSAEVREWMLNPINYLLEPRSFNRSRGAKLGLTYDDPETRTK